MITTYLKLVGYTRFRLNDFDSIELTFSAILQLIIGSNGSGKSSLLEQLSPGVPDANDFTKMGSKVLKLTHQNSHYVLHTVFSPKRHHSFQRDGVELNEGGTATVFQELCKEHFNYTPDVHRLLLGREKFTDMAATRRGWVQPIFLPSLVQPSSCRYCGSCVVLPEPVSPQTMTT